MSSSRYKNSSIFSPIYISKHSGLNSKRDRKVSESHLELPSIIRSIDIKKKPKISIARSRRNFNNIKSMCDLKNPSEPLLIPRTVDQKSLKKYEDSTASNKQCYKLSLIAEKIIPKREEKKITLAELNNYVEFLSRKKFNKFF